jgi:hypothetical protein
MTIAELGDEIANIWRTHTQLFINREAGMLSTLVELDVHTLNAIRDLIRPIVQTAAINLHGDVHRANALTEAVEKDLISAIQVAGTREHKLSTLVGGNAVYQAGAIKHLLKDIPDDRRVLSQIVGSETGVYNAYFELGILDDGAGPVVISAGHPELKHLPMCTDENERNQKIDQLIEELNRLRG